MPNIINASTSSGLVQTADTSGTIDFQSSGATKLTVSTSGTSIAQYTPATSLITNGTAQTAPFTAPNTFADFTGIPSWVERITIMFAGVSTSGTSSIQIQLGDSGGIETSGYLGALLRTGASSLATAQYPTTGFLIINDVAAADSHSGVVVISLLGSNNWCGASQISETSSTSFFSGSGNKALSATLDRVRITTVNGTDTFDAGSINILYE